MDQIEQKIALSGVAGTCDTPDKAEIARLRNSLSLAHRQVDNMTDVLRRCQEKLELCFKHHGPVYIGGTEHSHLMKLIDAALPKSTT